jgi:hypothetical protein
LMCLSEHESTCRPDSRLTRTIFAPTFSDQHSGISRARSFCPDECQFGRCRAEFFGFLVIPGRKGNNEKPPRHVGGLAHSGTVSRNPRNRSSLLRRPQRKPRKKLKVRVLIFHTPSLIAGSEGEKANE